MIQQKELNKDWLVKYTDYGQGERFGFHTAKSTLGWLPAKVPGDVHLDLMAAGMITDPFYGLNSDHCIWMEEKDWWYRTLFSVPDLERIKLKKRVYLMFHGLDTYATVYLNGEKIAAHRNMFVPLKLDITQKILSADNDVRVCLGSPAYSPDIHRDPDIARTPPQRLCTRKAQSCYGWDIAPRLVTIGIWRPVEILICDELEIIDSWLHTKQFAGNTAEVELDLTIAANDIEPHQLSVDIEVYDQRRLLQLNIDSSVTYLTESFFLENPPLWWPHNHGSPTLLPYSIKIMREDQIIDQFNGEFGVRTIELIQEPIGNERTSCYFNINNKPVFLKGMNWTPCDAIYARITDEKYYKLLKTTVRSNINALRVWGGGFYESNVFYNLCDKMGIMVWQDFMFACGVYPQEPEFLTEVKHEAEFVVQNLRRHPSIFVWCGDNEVDWVYLQENMPDYHKNKINREILPETCKKLDSSRPYIPSSPFSGNDEHPNACQHGNVHLWKHGSSYRDDYYVQCTPNMVTEIGHISLPHIDLIKSFIPENKLWPPFNEYWYLHCSDPLRSGESYRVNSWFTAISNRELKKPENLDALIACTQQLQSEATTFWIEHFSQLPECWGIFLWNLCDCWPQISDAYIAYDLHEKPALKAVQEGYKRIAR